MVAALFDPERRVKQARPTGMGLCDEIRSRDSLGHHAMKKFIPFLSLLCSLGPNLISMAAAPRPNFLLIFTDDHGYGDVSAYHPTDVRTPNIDRIGKEGLVFTSLRANITVCSPSRVALLTGRHADRVGVPGVIRTQPENSCGRPRHA